MSDVEATSSSEETIEPAAPAAPPAGVRWTMAILALGALGGSAVLTYQSMGQSLLPGCGPESGCDAVLSSAWSKWLGVPVSLPAMALYAVMFAATFFIGPGRSASQRHGAWVVLWVGAIVAIGAAIWFSALQAVVIQAFCRYCTAVHVTAVALAVMVLIASPRPRSPGLSFHPAPWTLVGLVLIAVLGFGQALQPAPPAPVMQASVLDGRLAFRPDEVPSTGSPNADVWMVYLFDYTCGHCRRMHPQLQAVHERYGERLGLIYLPTPLNADCNPMVSRTAPAAEHACDLALLAMAVWKADPEQFGAFNAWLYSTDSPPTPDEARAHAVELVGEQALAAAIDSGWPTEHIENSMLIYQHLAELTERWAVPTLIVGSAIFGATPDPETLFEGLEHHTTLEPPANAQP